MKGKLYIDKLFLKCKGKCKLVQNPENQREYQLVMN